MKKVEGAKWEAQRPADKSEAAQAERMAVLERERIILAKAVNDLEMSIQREETAHQQIVERQAALKARLEDAQEGHGQLNDERIRAAVYRDLGLVWSLEELNGLTSLEQWRDRPLKCRIIAGGSNDIFTLSFTPQSSGSNTFEDANLIWEHLSK